MESLEHREVRRPRHLCIFEHKIHSIMFKIRRRQADGSNTFKPSEIPPVKAAVAREQAIGRAQRVCADQEIAGDPDATAAPRPGSSARLRPL
jgi:hypothetical protein